MNCWLRLRRHGWAEVERVVENRHRLMRMEAMAPGLIPAEALMGAPRVVERCHCGRERRYYDTSEIGR